MKHLNNYKAFLEHNKDIENRSNYILDKIISLGIESITPEERKFLDSMKDKDSAIKAMDDYNSKFYDETFESEDGIFKFNLKSITTEDSNSDDGIITLYQGTMSLSNDIITEIYEGIFELNEQGIYMSNFYDGDNNDIKDSELFNESAYDNFLYELSIDVADIKIK